MAILTGNQSSKVIALGSMVETEIPKGVLVNRKGTGVADGTNGVSGVSPYLQKVEKPSVVLNYNNTCQVEFGGTIVSGDFLGSDGNGKAIAVSGGNIRSVLTL